MRKVGLSVAFWLALTSASSADSNRVYDWSGFYIGAHAGYGWSDVTYYDPAFPSWSLNHQPSGFLGGAQAGYNFQFNRIVVGVEADLSWGNIAHHVVDTVPGFAGDSFHAKINWIGTVAARAGIVFGPALPYAKAGHAWAESTHTFQFAQTPGFGPASLTETRGGFLVGAGVEYIIAPRWTLKAEYNYADFGRTGLVTFLPLPDGFIASFAQDLHLVKLGLNYRFASSLSGNR